MEQNLPLSFTPLEWRFLEALALIVLACLFVPLSKRLGLGPIIGYLSAGLAAGIALSLSFNENPQALLNFAEFGIVLFLFVIGLEFRPARLWEMRSVIFGRGLAQLLATSSALTILAFLYGLEWRTALVTGFGLAMSSTALVARSLDDAGERATPFGQSTIGILLFEDLSIVPLLLLVALLAPTAGSDMTFAGNAMAVAGGLGAIAFLILVGRYALDPMFGILARARVPELMTAAALGVVIFAALLMALVGLSYAMGAFIAGVLLAESSYRHQVEADIEPFRGLFLGLFFIAVGLSLNLQAVADNWWLIAIAVPLTITVKGLAVYAINRAFGVPHEKALRLGFALAQHGEFGFVLFAAAASALLLPQDTAAVLVAIVTISMAISSQQERLYNLVAGKPAPRTMLEDFADADGRVLIIGFGRFGQMMAQTLLVEGVPVTLLDADADRVTEARRFGSRVYFGDGTNRDVLVSAGASNADLIAVCTDDPATTDRIVVLLKSAFPNAKIIARAFDRIHVIQLDAMGAHDTVRETALSAMDMGSRALKMIGFDEAEREQAMIRVRERDQQRLERQRDAIRTAKDRKAAIKAIMPEPVRKQK
ncbi:MAG: cation:proton antiporter [Pseudomonadota bacterium]